MATDDRDWNSLTNEEQSALYAESHIRRFREDVKRCEIELAKARERLEIAERQRANGQLTTGRAGYNKSFFKSDEELSNDS